MRQQMIEHLRHVRALVLVKGEVASRGQCEIPGPAGRQAGVKLRAPPFLDRLGATRLVSCRLAQPPSGSSRATAPGSAAVPEPAIYPFTPRRSTMRTVILLLSAILSFSPIAAS